MWADGLAEWYEVNGRHDLPWRRTRDPWAVLVSEVMLQQTQVSRVLPRWITFLSRWPDARAFSDATLDDVLREWQGLGYPRRALALHRSAASIAAQGWPDDEAGMRKLPGVGSYTARALLAFGFDADCGPPRDVNLSRVAARAALGIEAHEADATTLDRVLGGARPAETSMRDHAYALFDLGALVCTARRPACPRCPLATRCASRVRLRTATPNPPPRRQTRFEGSTRQLRGAVMRALLSPDPPATLESLGRHSEVQRLSPSPAGLMAVVGGLRRDGLIAAPLGVTRASPGNARSESCPGPGGETGPAGSLRGVGKGFV